MIKKTSTKHAAPEKRKKNRLSGEKKESDP